EADLGFDPGQLGSRTEVHARAETEVRVALDIIGQQDDPRWCSHLYTLFRRTDPAQPAPSPHIWMTSLRFLLRYGHHAADVIAALPKAAGTEIGEAVLLALEHAPELALPLNRAEPPAGAAVAERVAARAAGGQEGTGLRAGAAVPEPPARGRRGVGAGQPV